MVYESSYTLFIGQMFHVRESDKLARCLTRSQEEHLAKECAQVPVNHLEDDACPGSMVK